MQRRLSHSHADLPSLDQAAVRGVRRPNRPIESNENFIVAFLVGFVRDLLPRKVSQERKKKKKEEESKLRRVALRSWLRN